MALQEKIDRSGIKGVHVANADEAHDKVQIRFKPMGGNHDVNRWNMHLPSRSPFLDPEIVGNPLIIQIVRELIDDPVLFMIASDTPFPGSTFQNIHQDYFRFGITVNVPLVEFTETNAPLEVWPTSHLAKDQEFSFDDVAHSKSDLEDLVARVESKRPLLRVGNVLLRDHRLVHRGTHNASDAPRPALSLWYGLQYKPAPHRTVANLCQRLSLFVRERARVNGKISNERLLNMGNAAGRVVDEFSNTDRDYRRRIDGKSWNALSDAAKQTLRFAEVEGEKSGVTDLSAKADLAMIRAVGLLLKNGLLG